MHRQKIAIYRKYSLIKQEGEIYVRKTFDFYSAFDLK